MATHQGSTLHGPTKDTLRFKRSTLMFALLFGLIGIAINVAVGCGLFEFAAAHF